MEEEKKDKSLKRKTKILFKDGSISFTLGHIAGVFGFKKNVKGFAGDKEMTDKELRDIMRLAVIIKENGEEVKEKIEETNKEGSQQEGKKINIKKVIPIAIGLAGIAIVLSFKSCSTPTLEPEPNIINTSTIVYNVENSAEYPYLILGQAGQEGATARLVGLGDYDDKIHSEKEEITIESYQQFTDMKIRFQDYMRRLESDSLSNTEKTQIFREIVKISTDMVNEYKKNEVLIQQYKGYFMDQTDSYPDEKTIMEKSMINNMITEFMGQYDLSVENEAVFEMFNNLLDMGYEIEDLSVTRNEVGRKTNSYEINATLIEKLVTEQEKIDESSLNDVNGKINKMFNGEKIDGREEERNDE